jgi:hypothetical protein
MIMQCLSPTQLNKTRDSLLSLPHLPLLLLLLLLLRVCCYR